MSGREKVARGELLKDQGNTIFKLGPSHYGFARQKWTKAIKLVDQAFDLETAEEVRSSWKDQVGRSSGCEDSHHSGTGEQLAACTVPYGQVAVLALLQKIHCSEKLHAEVPPHG